MIILDLSGFQVSGKNVANEFERHRMTVNKNAIPNDPKSFVETSGVRIGTAAETTRGHDIEWFKRIANDMARMIHELELNA